VAARATQVSPGALERALELLLERPLPTWDRRRHYQGGRDRTAAYVLVLDTINFCFWPGRGGYWRLAEGIRDAFRAGEPLWDPDVLAGLTAERLARWTGDLPLMEERVTALREVGRLGDPIALVEATAVDTARGLAARLTSFADVAAYEGREVPFLKRAQIAAADLAGAGAADFHDLAELTCFADYKLPQALRHLGVLVYSDQLARQVDDWRELAAGERAEVEIRAATVVAVERLRESLAERGRPLRSFEVDWLLWDYAQGLYPVRPHHRTRTVFY
jgi:hypothetical protein